MMTTVFHETEKNVEMSFTLLIPKKSGNPVRSDIDSDERSVAMMNIIKAFSPRIIASFERRMQACQRNLLNHLEDIEYNDGMHICWSRKNGTYGYFNIPSFNAMKDAIKALSQGQFKSFVENKFWIDQALKALLNDTEQDHSDSCGYCYSQLVTVFCELHCCE